MTITVDITPEVKAALARQAAAPPAPSELEDQTARPRRQRPPGRKSLAELFAESPFRGLDLDFERDRDPGRDIDL
jgi:hypothetical protein